MHNLFSLKYAFVLNLEQYHYCRANIKLKALELRLVMIQKHFLWVKQCIIWVFPANFKTFFILKCLNNHFLILFQVGGGLKSRTMSLF